MTSFVVDRFLKYGLMKCVCEISVMTDEWIGSPLMLDRKSRFLPCKHAHATTLCNTMLMRPRVRAGFHHTYGVIDQTEIPGPDRPCKSFGEEDQS